MNSLVVAVGLAIGLGMGCASSPAPAPTVGEPTELPPEPLTRETSQPQAAAWTHPATGMVFPATIAGFTREDREARDPREDGTAVNYKRIDDDVAVLVTVYIYPQVPAAGGLDTHFRAAKAAVMQNTRGIELLAEGPMELDQDGEIQAGRRAHFLIANEDEPYPPQITHLFMFQHGPWFIKYRTIFLAFQHEKADQANLTLMRELRWPAANRGRLAAWDAVLGPQRWLSPAK